MTNPDDAGPTGRHFYLCHMASPFLGRVPADFKSVLRVPVSSY